MYALTEGNAVTLIVAFMTLIGTIVGAYYASGARREARGANAAVNNVPEGTDPLPVRMTHLEEKVEDLIVTKAEVLAKVDLVLHLLTPKSGLDD